MVVRALVVFFLLLLGFMAVALISALSAEKGEVRRLPRGVWALVIVLLPLAGPALYLWLGRPQRVRRATAGAAPSPAPRPVAPDDDPDFLRRLRGTAGPVPGVDPWANGESRTSDERPPTDG